jgi:hypothetical protein
MRHLMRSPSIAVLLCSVSACATSPISFLVASPQPADAVFACALRKVNELGYTVTNSNKDAGFIAAQKDRSNAVAKFLSNEEKEDQLTISIFSAADGKRQLRATAGSSKKRSTIFSQQTSTEAPSKEGIGAANDLLLACGEGVVSRQSAQAGYTGITLLAH